MLNFDNLNPFGRTAKASTEITRLCVYPIKSCRGFSISSTNLTVRGLDLDRSWMLVKATDKKFVTIRNNPKLTLIDTAVIDSADEDAQLVTTFSGHPDKRVAIPARPSREWLEENTSLADVTIWRQATDAYVYREEVNAVFSAFLGERVMLTYKGPTTRKPRFKKGNGPGQVNFPDMMPLLIANEKSIEELNDRLKAQGDDAITIEHFRPNIVVRGGDSVDLQAWGEDNWRTVRIVNGPSLSSFITFGPSTIEIDIAWPCERCGVPNVNPNNGVKHAKQPWGLLNAYRKLGEGKDAKPCFGVLCVSRSEGEVEVGMKVQVLETNEKR